MTVYVQYVAECYFILLCTFISTSVDAKMVANHILNMGISSGDTLCVWCVCVCVCRHTYVRINPDSLVLARPLFPKVKIASFSISESLGYFCELLATECWA